MTSQPTPPLLAGHVLDLSSSRAYTAVTPAEGGFMRLTGRMEVKSET
jgi:hypothetical protein